MFSIKRALWGIAFAAAAVFLTPGLALCVEEDLYIYRLLFGRVYFEYETGSSEENGRTLEHSAFQQTYSLDTLGNILSRRLITYDAGLSYTLDDYEQEQTTIESKYLNFYLSSTLLPKSNIPLKLYGSRYNESTVTTVENERTRTIYGLNWLARFRTLPDTRLMIESQNDSSSSSDITTTQYNLNLSKKIGPTENFLYYNLNTTTDNFKDGNDSRSQAINFNNQTHISRSTRFDFGISRGDNSNDNPASPESSVTGVTVGLQSRPSIDFNQDHRYTYYSSSNDSSESTNGTYAGNMAYRFTDRLNSNLGLTAGETTSESPDKTETSKTFGFGFGLNYRLSKKLSLSETVSYSKSETSAATPTNPNRELFRMLTHLNYSDRLSWANLATSVRLGYNKDKTTEELSGSGVEQGISVNLSDIDVNRYFLFNTSADWDKVYNLSGNVWSDNKTFQAAAFNKFWRRYVLFSAKFSKAMQSSWISASEAGSQNLTLNATSTYFRNTRIEFMSEHTQTFDTVIGDSEIDSETLTVTHNRYLAGGSLDFGFIFNMLSSEYEGGSDEFTSTSFFARYDKKLRRNLNWLASASVSRGRGDNESFRNVMSFSNLLTYQLRSWLLSAEQKYNHNEDQNRDLIENTLIFRALRQFTWML